MDRKRFEEIRAKYGKVASWAIWDPDDYDDPTIIEKHVEELTTRYVFVGLNVSNEISQSDWKNFHCRHRGGSDYKLMEKYNDSPYRGAYMTDILKDWVEVDSSEIERSVKENPERLQENIELFLQELADIGAEDSEVFVFGNAAWNIFVNSPDLRRLKIKKLVHYGYRYGRRAPKK